MSLAQAPLPKQRNITAASGTHGRFFRISTAGQPPPDSLYRTCDRKSAQAGPRTMASKSAFDIPANIPSTRSCEHRQKNRSDLDGWSRQSASPSVSTSSSAKPTPQGIPEPCRPRPARDTRANIRSPSGKHSINRPRAPSMKPPYASADICAAPAAPTTGRQYSSSPLITEADPA